MSSEKGFLLSYIKYGDSDAILHCFTKENGFKSYFAIGVYAPKSRKKAYLVPLNELYYFSSKKRGNSSLDNLSKLEPAGNFSDLYQNTKACAVIFFVADFLKQILKNEGENQRIYQGIVGFIDELCLENYSAHLNFLIEILRITGVLPLSNAEQFLNPAHGTFSNTETHHLFDREISELWKQLIISDNPYEISISSKLRKPMLQSILTYYHYHYTDFRTPDSLKIIQQIM